MGRCAACPRYRAPVRGSNRSPTTWASAGSTSPGKAGSRTRSAGPARSPISKRLGQAVGGAKLSSEPIRSRFHAAYPGGFSIPIDRGVATGDRTSPTAGEATYSSASPISPRIAVPPNRARTGDRQVSPRTAGVGIAPRTVANGCCVQVSGRHRSAARCFQPEQPCAIDLPSLVLAVSIASSSVG